MAGLLSVGDAVASSLHETMAGWSDRKRTLAEAEDGFHASMVVAAERFHRRMAFHAVSETMAGSWLTQAYGDAGRGYAVCESPIERMLLPWLMFEDYGPLVRPPRIHIVNDDAVPPICDVVIVPQFQFAKCRLDFAVFVWGMHKERHMLAVECDGSEWHDIDKDRTRDKYLEGFGIPTIRASGSEIHQAPEAVSARLASIVIGLL